MPPARGHEASRDILRHRCTPKPTSPDSIPEPEPAHIPDGIPAHEREATELLPQSPTALCPPCGETDDNGDQPPLRISRILTPSTISPPLRPILLPIANFWRHNIQLTVPHNDCRDHLANERTFLGYLRTSVALSMIGIVIAQLWRLQHSPHPDPVFGFYVLSIPLAVIFQCAALLVVCVGAVRFWRQQDRMAVYGKVVSGGWEMVVVGLGTLLLVTTMFVLHVALDIRHKQLDAIR